MKIIKLILGAVVPPNLFVQAFSELDPPDIPTFFRLVRRLGTPPRDLLHQSLTHCWQLQDGLFYSIIFSSFFVFCSFFYFFSNFVGKNIEHIISLIAIGTEIHEKVTGIWDEPDPISLYDWYKKQSWFSEHEHLAKAIEDINYAKKYVEDKGWHKF